MSFHFLYLFNISTASIGNRRANWR